MKIKHILLVMLLSILLIPCFVKAEEDESNNIKLDSISLLSKSENAEEVSSAKLDGRKLSLDLKLYDPGDYVEYSIKIKNVSEKEYTFDKSTFKVEKEYLTYEFSYDEESNILKPNEERILKLKVLYTNKVPETKLVNDSFNAENSLIISLTNDDRIVPIINPETGLINPLFYVSIMILSGIMLLVIFKGSKKAKVIVVTLFTLTIIPLYTYALTKIDIDVNAKILIDGKEAYFLPGPEVNIKMKQLAGNDTSSSGVSTTDNNIIIIKLSKTEPKYTEKGTKNIVSLTDSPYPIYMWYEDGTIYWWSEDKTPSFNSNSSSMFYNLRKLADINDFKYFDTSKAENFRSMFYNTMSLKFLYGLENWDTANVNNMYATFTFTGINNLKPLKNWNVSNVTNLTATFAYNTSLESIEGLEDWDVSNVLTMEQTFAGHSSIGDIPIKSLEPLKKWNVSKVTNFNGLFVLLTNITNLSGLEDWNVSSVTNMGSMFSSCTSLKDISALKNWDVSNVVTMDTMFKNNKSLENINGLENWNVSKVKDMSQLFVYTQIKNLIPLSNWKTSSLEDMRWTFAFNDSLTSLEGLEDWDVSNVTTMHSTFAALSSLENTDAISNWNSTSLEYATNLLNGCTAIKQLNLSNFRTPVLKDLQYAFNGLENLEDIDLSGLDTRNVTTFKRMFNNSTKLKHIYVGDNWSTASNTDETTYVFPSNSELPNFDSTDSTRQNLSHAYVGDGGYLSHK